MCLKLTEGGILSLVQIDWRQHAENWTEHVKKNDPETGTSSIAR